MTEAKEQLVKEYLKWAAKFEDARDHLNRVLPARITVNAQGKPRPFILTEEMLIEYSQIRDEMEEAWSHMRVICDKVTKL